MVKVTINFLLLNDWFIGVLDLLGLFYQSLVAWIVSDRCFLEFPLYDMYQREREFARERDSIYLQVYVTIMLPINVHATDLWDMLWLFILNSACFNAINQQEKMKRGDNAFMLLTTVCSVYVIKQCRQWIHDTHCTNYRLLMYATYVINLWYMLSNDDACSTWSWSIRMLINMILVTRFIDAVNNNYILHLWPINVLNILHDCDAYILALYKRPERVLLLSSRSTLSGNKVDI